MAPFKTAVIDRDGALLPCCDYMPTESRDKLTKVNNLKQWWTIELEDLRNDLREGRTNSGCHHCLSKEINHNYLSQRKVINKQYKELSDQVTDIDSIEIRVSNYCNLKCLMCGSYASSSIAQEYREHEAEYNSIGMTMPYEETVRWWDNFKLDPILTNVKSVYFSGGEPLLVPEVLDILSALDSNTNVSINTNLTRVSNKFLDVIEKFKQITIYVSLEGIGHYNDYIRFGSDWAVIDINIKQLLALKNVRLVVNHVLQHTSLFTLPKLINYTDSLGLELILNEVYYGSYPSPGVLTVNSAHPEDVAVFKQWVDSYSGAHKAQLTTWVNTYNFDVTLNAKFTKYIDMLDRIRGCNFTKTFRT
jgi:sulfatase maturation enzyme AslB (radical SAM superfamily)